MIIQQTNAPPLLIRSSKEMEEKIILTYSKNIGCQVVNVVQLSLTTTCEFCIRFLGCAHGSEMVSFHLSITYMLCLGASLTTPKVKR